MVKNWPVRLVEEIATVGSRLPVKDVILKPLKDNEIGFFPFRLIRSINARTRSCPNFPRSGFELAMTGLCVRVCRNDNDGVHLSYPSDPRPSGSRLGRHGLKPILGVGGLAIGVYMWSIKPKCPE